MSKRLGQVFLRNKHIQKKIAEYILCVESDSLVEIGPGSGAITNHIYPLVLDKLTMVEIDERLIKNLSDKFPRANLIWNDFLKVDFSYLDVSKRNLLFGNIPYYITSPIIFKFLKEKGFNQAILMVQKEYAELLLAKSKTSRYSGVSALVQSFVSVQRVLEVEKTNFFPIPKVDSTVVRLIKDKNEGIGLENYSLFLRKCFGMPRKTLWNNLKNHFEKAKIEKAFEENKLDLKVRPEEIEAGVFISLFEALE